MKFTKTQKNKKVTIRAVVDDSEVGRVEYRHIQGGIYLSYVDVDKPIRRKGIGRALVKEVLDEEPEFIYAVPKNKSGRALMVNLDFEQAVKGQSHYVWGNKEAYNKFMRPYL
ncbi:MAG: N-acetyltransferase [Candidatus Altiarchaeota archaeon]|nr:N-acetyltransferase [Candidatus Altiarchaeota archaeon]